MELASIFRDNMVFQAGKPIRVFGSGEGEARVYLLDTGLEAAATVRDGHWLAELPPMPAGGPYSLGVWLDGPMRRLDNIYIGQVLLCAGQSNMQFTMAEETTPPECYAADDGLRLFAMDRPELLPEGECRLDSTDGWLPCRRGQVELWPALGYLVGRALRAKKQQAVGIVLCAQGASVIQSWLPPQLLPACAQAIPPQELFCDHTVYPLWNPPGFLYREMLAPLLPFSFGGVIWYQGESNASPAEGAVYLPMLQAMVEHWRAADDDSTLPFVIVQIADTRRDEGWLAVQKAQAAAPAAIPHLQMVASADVCEPNEIHPPTKSRLAERIAALL